MELIFGLIVGGAATVVSMLAARDRRRTRARIWREAADRVGLTAITQPEGAVLFSRAELSGCSGPLAVRLERLRQSQAEHRTRLTVSGLGHGAHGVGGLSLRRRDLGTTLQRLLGGDIEVGSSVFDQEFSIQGEAALALAVLDAETRHRVAGLLGGAFRGERVRAALRDGVLEVWLWERGRGLSARALADVIGGVLDVARRLTAPADLAARIAENLRGEPEEGVRLQSVTALARQFPHHPATREALLAARLDPSDEVRLQAAIALGNWGREILLDLVETTASDSCAARAVQALGGGPRGLAPERLEAALRKALTQGRADTARACLEALGGRARTESEGLLLEALGSGDSRISVAAARVLGRVGTVAAIGPLREAIPFVGGELGSAARQAIAEIQARLTGAEPGQLSLTGDAGDGAGALSLAGDEPGQLSLTADEPSPSHATPAAVQAQ